MTPCPSCRRLVRREDRACPHCARRRAIGVAGVAALVLASCEPAMHPVVVEPARTDPAIDPGPKSSAPPAPTASAPPTPERTPKRGVIQIVPLYGCPPLVEDV